MPLQHHTPRQCLTGLYVILDCDIAGERPLTDIARNAIEGGGRLFQYREKHLPKKEMYRIATELRAVTARVGATLIVNDFSDVALAVEADGVHLGQDDLPLSDARNILGPNRLIGISTHSIAQAVEAENGGADYVGFGPIYDTRTKDTGLTPLGPQAARALRAQLSIPVFGIGGINLTNVAELRTTGMHGIAVASAVLQAPNIETETRALNAAWMA